MASTSSTRTRAHRAIDRIPAFPGATTTSHPLRDEPPRERVLARAAADTTTSTRLAARSAPQYPASLPRALRAFARVASFARMLAGVADELKPPVAIRITRPYATEQEFLEREFDTLTHTSVILLGAQARPQGVVLRFEIVLEGRANPILRGEGRRRRLQGESARGRAGPHAPLHAARRALEDAR